MNDDGAGGVKPGDILAGKYLVEHVLGAGGMGVVVAARHVQLETKVAIKFLLPHMLQSPEAVTRFAREARAAVRITSEHVARVFDVGTLDTGAPYIVMEFLEGGDLAAWLHQRGPLPIDIATEFVLQAIVAVAEAHALGIVHRDLKPANLFCIRRPDGQLSIKVLDFGISKVLATTGSEAGMSVTKTSAMLGSPSYMSPEQMQSATSADARSDIWALGVILYELLTGRPPFRGATLPEVAVRVVTQALPSVREARPDVPPGLEAVIVRCLEKDPKARFPNVAELATALAEYAPKRARASIERILGTIQAAGLSADALSMPPSAQPGGTMALAGTMVPTSQTSPGTAGVAVRTAVLIGVSVAGVLAMAGALLLRHAGTFSDPPTEPTVLAGAPTATVPPPAASTAANDPPPGPPAASPTSSLPPVHTPPDDAPKVGHASHRTSPEPQPTSLPIAPPATPAPPVATPKPPSACDPPYTFDEQGRKHFKHECYSQH